MNRYALLLFILFPFAANASTFVSEQETDVDPRGILWDYVFKVQTGPHDTPTDLLVTEYSCYKIQKHQTVRITTKPWKCFETEAAARAQALKEASIFEANLIASGKSSTEIEKFKALHKPKTGG